MSHKKSFGSKKNKDKVAKNVRMGKSDRSSVTTVKMEEDFPRGGEEVLTPLEKRGLQYQAEQDVLFGKSTQKKAKKHEVAVKVTGESFLFEILTEGMLLLGAVSEIHHFKLVISLPNNMTGTVSIGDISDPITETANTVLAETTDDAEKSEKLLPVMLSSLFHIGQLVVCCVRCIHKNHIQLSLNPRLVNTNITDKSILPNMVMCGWVSSVEDHGYVVDFGIANKTGFILKKNAAEFIKQKCTDTSLAIGQVVMGLVLEGPSAARTVSLSINPQLFQKSVLSAESFLPLSSLLPGFLMNVTVKTSSKSGLLVNFLGGFEGSVSLFHLPFDKFDVSHFTTGKKFKARLLWVDVLNKRMGLSLQKHIIAGTGYQFGGLEIGDMFDSGRVVGLNRSSGIFLELVDGVYGYSPVRLLYDEKQRTIEKVHSKGTVHSCRVVQFNVVDGFVIVALKQSIIDKPFMKFSDIKPGTIVSGVVKTLTERGVYVKLDSFFDGFCPNTELSDSGGKRMRKKFTEGSLVKCRVLVTDHENQFILLTCRKSLIRSELPPLVSYEETQPGQFYDGVIVAVISTGLVVKFFNRVKGFVPKAEVKLSSAQESTDLNAFYKKGQVVKCRVLNCVPKNQRLLLSLKIQDDSKLHESSCNMEQQTPADNIPSCEVQNNKQTPVVEYEIQDSKQALLVVNNEADTEIQLQDIKPTPTDNATGESDYKSAERKSKRKKNDSDDAVGLLPHPVSVDSDQVTSIQSTQKKTKRQKKAAKVAEESFLYEKEFELLKTSKPLQTADDFDRQLAINPNSSALWLQYMAYYLHMADVEKARTIARKALSTISFREEQEKLNVWNGLLNLENSYGSQESLMATFQEALKGNDQLPLYHKLVEMYQTTDKLDLVEQVYQTMVKKFSSDPQVWISYALFLIKSGRIPAARNLLQRSLKSLPRQSQIQVISKFAQFEVKFGDSERGRTMFESLVSTYPKRIDLWSVYIDQMTTKGHTDVVRNIFERAVCLKVNSKKIKFLFKKYIAFEERHGTPSTVNKIKEKAKQFEVQDNSNYS